MGAIDRPKHRQAAHRFNSRISGQRNWLQNLDVLWRGQAQDRFTIAVAIAQSQEAVSEVAGWGYHQCPIPEGDCAQANIIAKQAQLTNA